MDISELTAYAEEKYHIGERQRRKLFTGVSVLVHPSSGKWVAVLMRAWDELRGEEVQLCDLKCGHGEVHRGTEPYLTAPHRMKGADWVGVRFGADTRRETVFRLFDEAMSASRSWGYTVTLGSMLPSGESEYHDTPLPRPGNAIRTGGRRGGDGGREFPSSALSGHLPPEEGNRRSGMKDERRQDGETARGSEAPLMPGELRRRFLEARDALLAKVEALVPDSLLPKEETKYRDTPLPGAPEKLREMRRLYDHRDHSYLGACKNFYVQGKFMEDYEDDASWNGELRLYYPSYHDLRLEQLRGYFTWRTALRKGQFKPICTSLAYIYVYELLNEIGAADAEDSLRKLREFEAGFLDSGVGDPEMRRNLRRWMLEKAVVSGLPPEKAREYADPEMLKRDAALAALRDIRTRSDGEIFDALVTLGGRKLPQSPVVQQLGEEGKALFARVWRLAAAKHRQEGKTLFTLCFGGCRSHRWDPLSNALYCQRKRPAAGTYELDETRSYTFNGVWTEKCYQERSFNKKLLEGLLHETDRQLRLYLKLGRRLQERWEEAWAAPYAEAVIEEDRHARAEADRKKVTIDLSGLEQIRRDAMETRDSLLTEEEMEAEEAAAAPASVPEERESAPAGEEAPPLPLEPELRELLALALEGKPTKAWLSERHRMPTVAVDAVNEAFYDEIGDSVLEWDGEEITLAEDYREDVLRLLGEVR